MKKFSQWLKRANVFGEHTMLAYLIDATPLDKRAVEATIEVEALLESAYRSGRASGFKAGRLQGFRDERKSDLNVGGLRHDTRTDTGRAHHTFVKGLLRHSADL